MTAQNRITLDTNILVYSADSKDEKRRESALGILEKTLQLDCVLTLQALAEFYYTVVRKKIVPHKIALEIIQSWQTLFPVATTKAATLIKAIHTRDSHQLSFWDAMLVSTAHEAGVNMLLSEDFNHHQMIDGIRIVNPFQKSEFWQI